MSQWRHAFSLSKQELAEAEPPGTDKLIEHATTDITLLQPPPSTDPADPLNWPSWRKYAILATMSLYCASANFAAASVAPAIPILGAILRESNIHLSYLVAVNVLMIGTSNILWVPLAGTFGRRPILIISMILSVAFSIWCGKAEGYSSLLAARALQGFSLGPADSLAASVLGEVFFVHERGRAMAIYTIFLSGGSLVGGVSGGYIAGELGYVWIFWISAILLGITLLAQLFLMPETGFDRAAALRADRDRDDLPEHYLRSEKDAAIETIERTSPISSYQRRGKFTFAQSLKIGRYQGHLLRELLAPWLSLAFPGTWVVMLHYGGLLGGLVTISTIGPQILAMPPYLWGNNVGLINVGGLVGCVLGGATTYLVVDRLTKRSAKKSTHGLSEPEDRLPAMFPALIIATAGILCFGFSAASHSPKAWVGLAVGYGMVGFGITQVPSVGFNYLIDAYYPIAADCFVMTTIMRAVVGFAWTFFAAQWIERDGASLPFGIFGMIMGVFALLTIPLWLYGKRMRIATAGYLPQQH